MSMEYYGPEVMHMPKDPKKHPLDKRPEELTPEEIQKYAIPVPRDFVDDWEDPEVDEAYADA